MDLRCRWQARDAAYMVVARVNTMPSKRRMRRLINPWDEIDKRHPDERPDLACLLPPKPRAFGGVRHYPDLWRSRVRCSERSCTMARMASLSNEHSVRSGRTHTGYHPGYRDGLGASSYTIPESRRHSHTNTLVDSACEDTYSVQAGEAQPM